MYLLSRIVERLAVVVSTFTKLTSTKLPSLAYPDSASATEQPSVQQYVTLVEVEESREKAQHI